MANEAEHVDWRTPREQGDVISPVDRPGSAKLTRVPKVLSLTSLLDTVCQFGGRGGGCLAWASKGADLAD